MKGARSAGWTVREVPGGFGVFHRGTRWKSKPRPSRDAAIRYARSLADRWTDDAARLMLQWQRDDAGRQRGGPWRWTLPDGTTGVRSDVPPVGREADATPPDGPG